MLTTVDNPYNPHHKYNKWLQWDHDHGYYTQEYLGRLINLAADIDEHESSDLIELAMREIVEVDALGVYMTIEPDTPTPALDQPEPSPGIGGG